MYPSDTPRIHYTLDDMRADFVGRRDSSQPELTAVRYLGVIPPESLPKEWFDRMIAVIDAMTPVERQFANVLRISEARREELASITGVTPQEVRYLLGGRRAVEHTKNLFRDSLSS